MASQALYRRYRSQTFDELIGQEHVVQTLRNAMMEGRIAHAYLFTGPRGVGKTSMARLLAKAVNCTAPLPERPCGVCDSCVAIAEGRAVDVIEMDAASHTSVEDAREIIERVQFRPSLGAYKVYVIDEVHMLSTAAFNALLKTLEEPPGHALFILATTEIHKVPATILSRCQRFTFNRHTVAATVEHINAVAADESFVLEPGAGEAIARAATGSMRDALSLLDQLMAYGDTTITLEQVRNLLGATEAQEVAALVDALSSGDIAAALNAVAGVATQGADLRQFARDVVERLRSLMLLKAGGDTALLDVTDDELAALSAQAWAADLGALLQWVKLFSGLDQQLRAATIPQLPLEMAVVEALAEIRGQGSGVKGQAPALGVRSQAPAHSLVSKPAPPVVVMPPAVSKPLPVVAPRSLPPILNGSPSVPVIEPERPPTPDSAPTIPSERLEAILSDGDPLAEPVSELVSVPADEVVASAEDFDEPVDVVAPPILEQPPEIDEVDSNAVASDNAAVVALEQIEAVWQDVVRDVRVHDKMLQALLNSGVRPIDVQDSVIVLEVISKFLFSRLGEQKSQVVLERVISKHMGAHYTIRCVIEEQHRETASAFRDQIRENRKDPLIKAAMNIFDADIIAVKHDNEGV